MNENWLKYPHRVLLGVKRVDLLRPNSHSHGAMVGPSFRINSMREPEALEHVSDFGLFY